MTSETDARRSVAMTGAPLRPATPSTIGAVAIEPDLCAEAGKLLDVHEPVFEDGFANARGAVRPGHEGHELRLQVGGKARKRVGRHIDGLNSVAVAADPDAAGRAGDLGAGLLQNVEGELQQFGTGVLQRYVTPGHGDGHRIGAGLDPIRQNVVGGAVQAGDPDDGNLGGSSALDPGAHLDQALGKIA